MIELLEAYWPWLLLAVLIGVAVVWLLTRSARRTRVEIDRRDALDEGAGPMARNQALIDAPPPADPPADPAPADAVPPASRATGVPPPAAPAAPPATPVPPPAPAVDPRPAAPSAEPTPVVPPAGGVVGAGAGAAVAAAASAPSAPAPEPGEEDLTRMKGVGPKLAAMLREQGVTRFEQIAGWGDAEIARIDASLGRFQGRIRRDHWIEQARYLAKGDEAGHAAAFGAGGTR